MSKIHISEAARKYGVSVSTIVKWGKEAPPELIERVANLVLIDENYIIKRCIQMKRKLLEQAASINVELPEEKSIEDTKVA